MPTKRLLTRLAALALAVGGCKSPPCEDPERRAGYPAEVSRWAQPSDTGRYVLYPVGGGAPCKGEAPGPDEGTWGWDYPGYCLPARIVLGWWHGLRCQGGTGAYRTDGPHLEKKEGGGE